MQFIVKFNYKKLFIYLLSVYKPMPLKIEITPIAIVDENKVYRF